MIILLSVSLFSQQTMEKSTIYRTIYRCQHANTLMSALLHFLSRMSQAPQTMFGFGTGGSFVFGIAESLWSILTFARKQPDILTAHDLPTAFREHYPLANQSLLLILILTNHHATKDNPYRISLFGCSDSQGEWGGFVQTRDELCLIELCEWLQTPLRRIRQRLRSTFPPCTTRCAE